MGYKDDELYLRWLQYGVFSPINRLHSTSNEFMGKEPWKTKKEVENSATDYLRLRHRLIPYLYSINYLTHTQGIALCEPMYYSYDKKQAYATKNQYSFGTQLVVAPITQKTDPHTNLASTKLWVPEGERYTDIFTGRIYGEGEYEVYRDLEDFPVFAKKGSIIPLYKDAFDNGTGMDKALEVLVYSGDGEFTIYDDDGDTLDYEKGRFVMTKIIVRQNGDTLTLSLSSDGDKDMAAAGRNITLVFKDVVKADISTNAEGAEIKGKGKTRIRKPRLETRQQLRRVLLSVEPHTGGIPPRDIAVVRDVQHVGHDVALDRAQADVVRIMRAKIFVKRSDKFLLHTRYCTMAAEKRQAFLREKRRKTHCVTR